MRATPSTLQPAACFLHIEEGDSESSCKHLKKTVSKYLFYTGWAKTAMSNTGRRRLDKIGTNQLTFTTFLNRT